MENPAVLIWRTYKMREMLFIKCFIFLTVLIISSSSSYAEFYSGGPWRGKVIDSDTKEPIEGAVVIAIWRRGYECAFSSPTFFQEANEVLTDKKGRFEIPTYTENRSKSFWRTQDIQGDVKAELVCSGPEIRDPDFIIYKPSYGNFPSQDELHIYAIGPNSFTVEYQEFHKEIIKGQEITWAQKKAKTFPEGVVYSGKRCWPKMETLEKTLPFEVKVISLLVPMNNAKQKLENLDITLDCPDNAEPIPLSPHGYKTDIVHPLTKGGYIIIELPKMKTNGERQKAIPSIPSEVKPDKLPQLYKLIKEEDKYFLQSEIRRKEQ